MPERPSAWPLASLTTFQLSWPWPFLVCEQRRCAQGSCSSCKAQHTVLQHVVSRRPSKTDLLRARQNADALVFEPTDVGRVCASVSYMVCIQTQISAHVRIRQCTLHEMLKAWHLAQPGQTPTRGQWLREDPEMLPRTWQLID